MVLKNLTQNTTLATDLKICASIADLSLGLLNPKNPRALLFKTRFGLHTFGLKETIDILVLDDKNKVVVTQENLGANRLCFWDPKYDTVVELPQGTIKSSQTKINDQIELT